MGNGNGNIVWLGGEEVIALSDFKPIAVELVLFDFTPIAMLCLLQIGGDMMPTIVESEYNGWSNRETWNANLWMTNSEPIYKLIGRLAKGCHSVSELADSMEGFLGILWNGKTPDGDSLRPVNWVEIAEAWAEANELYTDHLRTETD